MESGIFTDKKRPGHRCSAMLSGKCSSAVGKDFLLGLVCTFNFNKPLTLYEH